MEVMYIRIKRSVMYLFVGVITCGMCSCNDEIEDEVMNPERDSQYSGAEEAYDAVDALYRKGAPTFYGESTSKEGSVAAWGGFLSGFFDNEAKNEARLCDYSQQLSIDAVNIADWVDRVWNQSYDAITIANTAVENIPYTKRLTPTQKVQLVAEARFFRAFNYFYLVKAFGGVPLLRYGQTEMGVRESVSGVYRSIVSDLQTSIEQLPDTAFTENYFRISRTVAETVLADVYLTMSGYPLRDNRYRQAAEVAKRVIQSRKHCLTPHGDSPETSAYNVLRTEDVNGEYIYSYKVEERNVDESPAAHCLPQAANKWNVLKTKSTNNAYRPIRAYLHVYDSVYDIRMHEQQFFHTFYNYEKEGRTIIETYPQISYMWYEKEAIQKTGLSKKDIIIYRYPEVLLIAAEAIAQSEGVTSEAVGYLAEVRSRAYTRGDKNEVISQLSGLDKEKFIQEIWLEKMREFPFEMKLWADIQRTRKYPVTSAKNRGTATFVDVIGAQNLWGSSFEEKNLLLPLSQNELLKNVFLIQNPGYN